MRSRFILAALFSAALLAPFEANGDGRRDGVETASQAGSASPAAPTQASASQRAFVEAYCSACHNPRSRQGGLDLESLDPQSPEERAEVWEKAIRKVRGGMMPPAGAPRPGRAEALRFVASLERSLDAHAALHPDPGGKTLHRLNRTEYRNAVRDLFGMEVDVTLLLPADDSAEGFDNIAEALGVSPSLIEGNLSAAMKISRQAVGDLSQEPARVTYRPTLAQDGHIEGLPLGVRGGLVARHYFPLDGEYEITIAVAGAAPGGRGGPGAGLGAGAGRGGAAGRGGGGPAPGRTADVAVLLDGRPLDVETPTRFTLPMKAGPATLSAGVIDLGRPSGVSDIFSAGGGRGGGLTSLTIAGPRNVTGRGDSPSRRSLFVCRPQSAADEEACARRIFSRLASRAYRRPHPEGDPALEPLMAAYREGRAVGDFDVGVQYGVARVLVDPRFLFRMEQEPAGLRAGAVYDIDDFELASRLSFFLWSSIPDDELLAAAARGRLHRPAELQRQVARMLADPKSAALVENFAGQWLMLRELAGVEPDVRDFDPTLRASLRQETEMLFDSVLREDRSVVDLLDADYTFVNERLARHYGIPRVQGSYMRRVSLPADSPRRGLLGQGSILTVTSVADRTSPVARGKWVLENLLGLPVPLPPPGVETDLSNSAPVEGPTTLRARLELHQKEPVCHSCHSIMDPIGFAMEPFDLTGRWREADGGLPINPHGRMVDGTELQGPASLRRALLEQRETFVFAFAEKLLTYALGRPLSAQDMPAVRKIVRDAGRDDHRLTAVVQSIVESPTFRQRRASPQPVRRSS